VGTCSYAHDERIGFKMAFVAIADPDRARASAILHPYPTEFK
jgi:hypothetical protein